MAPFADVVAVEATVVPVGFTVVVVPVTPPGVVTIVSPGSSVLATSVVVDDDCVPAALSAGLSAAPLRAVPRPTTAKTTAMTVTTIGRRDAEGPDPVCMAES